ncbi:TerC family protein [Ramlibacter sp.]|uniref:TerC family protein n=1 Tax=Ramlibacter sp. TaxID=1917967 RepID=UPI00263790F0|nr:TerC family protein [Ramlibacter sp.]MDB5957921.1 Integral rane protein TerC [Ramlibacter sp.]
MDLLTSAVFWFALFKIILINIVLSGDNAVVIALACRSLPPQQQKKAIVFGSVGAIVMRVVLTFFAVKLLALPWLKLVGAALLLWIGIGLLKEEDEDDELEGHSGLFAAIKTIIVADLVMSIDNVIGVAAAANNDLLLLVIGLIISIPLIVFGSTLLLKMMGRFPIIITLGAALLGWVAGDMAMSDPAIAPYVGEHAETLQSIAAVIGAAIVVAVGKWLARRSTAGEPGEHAA